MTYTGKQRAEISREATGKIVRTLEYVDLVEEDWAGYWVMTFEDDTEISFRFMAELNGAPPQT